MMELKSVGMMTFPTEWKVIKFMFQTTNQDTYLSTQQLLDWDRYDLHGLIWFSYLPQVFLF